MRHSRGAVALSAHFAECAAHRDTSRLALFPPGAGPVDTHQTGWNQRSRRRGEKDAARALSTANGSWAATVGSAKAVNASAALATIGERYVSVLSQEAHQPPSRCRLVAGISTEEQAQPEGVVEADVVELAGGQERDLDAAEPDRSSHAGER